MTKKLLSSSLNPITGIKHHFSVDRNLGPFSFFCSNASPPPTPPPSSSLNSSDSVPKDTLFSRLVGVFNPKSSISQILKKWVDEGRDVDVDNIRSIIKNFRTNRRHHHALQVSEWIGSIQHSNSTPGDAAVHLDLIAKVRGPEQAEKYFESLPANLRVFQTYGALLNCYAKEKSLDKAEAIMQKMRQIGYNKTLCYNVMLILYAQMGKLEKLESLVQEMDGKDIRFDNFSYNIRLNAFIDASDIMGMEKLLLRMEADPFVITEWNSYSVAANGYLKAGEFEKAEMVLKKSERLIKSAKATGKLSSKARVKADENAAQAYQVLITLYARIGRKDEVYRLWNLHKKPRKFYNKSCFCVISSLLKLDDIDGAGKMLEEWLDDKIHFDIRIVNLVVTAFCRKGHMDKAESIISKLINCGNEPNASTWSRMAFGYHKDNQMEKAVQMTKKSVTASVPGFKPDLRVVASCLEYLKEKGDVDGAEELIRLLEERSKFPAAFRDRLSRYIRKGDPASKEFDQSEQESEDLEEKIFGDTELKFENIS